MNILIVNDDGVFAEGLSILVKAASHHGNVYVAAPKNEQSAKGSSITIKGPIMIEEIEPLFGSTRTIMIDGTPSDAVRAGVKIFDQEFDLVLSGVNNGVNLATDVHYSGTVSAAFEASLMGFHAIAFSAHDINLPYIYDETVKLLDEIIENQLYKGTAVLNINYPHQMFKKVLGTKITKLGLRIQRSEYVKSDKPNLYHLVGSSINFKEDELSDMAAFNEGYVSITPLQFDRTDYKKIKTTLEQD